MSDDTNALDRTPAQFFFEIGFGAAFAQALIANDGKAPFVFSDALVEHAWDIAGDAHDDHEEFDRYLAVANGLATDISAVWTQAEDNHRRYSDTGSKEGDIRFLTLGLTGEAGEVANFVKKRWRDGEGHDDDIRKEIADVCAYAFMLANTMGMSPADLIATIAEKQAVFVAKMQARATSEFSHV